MTILIASVTIIIPSMQSSKKAQKNSMKYNCPDSYFGVITTTHEANEGSRKAAAGRSKR
jgi:hypothetical protein